MPDSVDNARLSKGKLVSDDPDLDRLRALEERLAKATKAPTKPTSTAGTSFSQGEVAWRMVIELVSGMFLGLAIGYGLDALFGTLPVFLVITPMFLFSGTFFPLEQLPLWAQRFAWALPLTHLVHLARSVALGGFPPQLLANAAYLAIFGAVAYLFGVRAMVKRLIT